MRNRFKPEINGRGHWLASVMLNGPGRKQHDLGDIPLFGNQRKFNTGPMRRPENPKKVKNGKEG